MRGFANIIRFSVECFASRQDQGWLTPSLRQKLIIAVLLSGFLLVTIWIGAIVYFIYCLGAWGFS